jgi:hypothetical protein
MQLELERKNTMNTKMRTSTKRISWTLCASFALSATLSTGQAQIANSVTGVFALSDSGEAPLEYSTGTAQVKKSGLLEMQIKNHVKQFLSIPGDRSPVRLRQSPNAQVFLVRITLAIPADSSILANIAVFVPELRLLVRQKTERQFATSDITGTIIGAKNHDSSPRVLVNVSRQDDHTLRVSPQLPLLPGEYAFNTGEAVGDDAPRRYAGSNVETRTKVYCFGVD